MKVFWIPSVMALTLTVAAAFGNEPSLIVYSDVPGAEKSDQYRVAVRPLEKLEDWKQAFPFITRCKPSQEGENGYFKHLSGWSNTYVNIEMNIPVEVAVSKADGTPIRKAAVHPARHVKVCQVRNGKVYLTLEKPCLIAIDIDGQMDDQDTGMGFKGPAVHTMTVFANPMLKDRPALNDPRVLTVAPGQKPPTDGPWKTLYFLPGVHDIGVGLKVHVNKQYYIPGDAVVFGTFTNHDWAKGHDIRIFGYGTLSGERIAHPQYANPKPKDDSDHDPIHIVGAANSSVEGITVVDSAHHSVMLMSPYEEGRPTNIRWTKVFTWRVNGDGINPFSNGLIEDCFIRTQDDSTYVNSRGIRRVTLWNDYNGSSFVLSALPNTPLVVEDCDVIYSRSGWHKWGGGRVFNMRGEGEGDCGNGVVFRNIRAVDPRPTLQQFLISMQGLEPYDKPSKRRKPGDLNGILFQNISIMAPSVLGEKDILWGGSDAKIRNVTFDNLSIDGQRVRSLDHFHRNDNVQDILFR